MPRRLVPLLALAVPLALGGADWPRFRGPNGTGVSADAVPTTWSKTENVLWKRPLPGGGNGSAVVAGGKVFVQSAAADGATRSLHCLDAATGDPLWTKSQTGQRAKTHAKNSLASSTPAVDGGRVFAVFWDGRSITLAGYDVAGAELWTVKLGGYVSQHGAGMSPVAAGGNVYVNYDQDGAAEFLCFDAKTGAKKWAAARKPFRACYSTPFVRPLPGGKAEIVNASTAGITGYDPDTGAVNWNWDWPFDGAALRTVGSPFEANGLVVAVAGDGNGSRDAVVVEPGKAAKLLWQKRKDTPYVPGPVARGDHLYWVTDNGLAVCAELRTGKVLWSERVFNRSVSASPVLVAGNVVAVDEAGKAVVFKASPDGLDKVAENDLGEPMFATPAVANGRLYLRTAAGLYCVGKPVP